MCSSVIGRCPALAPGPGAGSPGVARPRTCWRPAHLLYSSACVPTPAMNSVTFGVHTRGWTGPSLLLQLASCFLAFKTSVRPGPPSADARWDLLRRKTGLRASRERGARLWRRRTAVPELDLATKEPCVSRGGSACFPQSGVGPWVPQAPHTGARKVPSLLGHQRPLWEVWRIPTCDSLALLMLRPPGHRVSLVCTCGFTRLSPEGT